MMTSSYFMTYSVIFACNKGEVGGEKERVKLKHTGDMHDPCVFEPQ
jgi:hypothetical protein